MNYNKVKPGDVVPCKHCGKEFEARWYSECYCSPNCKLDHKIIKRKKTYTPVDNGPVIAKCVHCGEEYTKRSNVQKYCTVGCKERAKGRRGRISGIGMIGNCRWCGKEFKKKRSNELYCSDECRNSRNLDTLKKKREKYGRSPDLRRGRAKIKTRICEECGAEFESDKLQLYCKSCALMLNGRSTNGVSYRIDKPRYATCQYCGCKFKTIRVKGLYCSEECKTNDKRLDSQLSKLNDVFYIIGYKLNNVYYLKFGVSNSVLGRIRRYRNANPFILSVYFIIEFDNAKQVLQYEKEMLIKTVGYETETCNEWRAIEEDEFINLLIELNEGSSAGNVINMDKHVKQMQ
jgi:hypothetical protein